MVKRKVKKTKESKNRLVRGFSRLKKKYYTPTNKKALKKFSKGFGKTVRGINQGTNSLVEGHDPYGIGENYFTDQFGSGKQFHERSASQSIPRAVARRVARAKPMTRTSAGSYYTSAVGRRPKRKKSTRHTRHAKRNISDQNFESDYTFGADIRDDSYWNTH